MSTEPTEGPDEGAEGVGGQVVPLRPAETVPPETRSGETGPGETEPAHEPIAVGYQHTDAGRRPIVPDRWRGRENVKRTVASAGERHWHAARYHGLRSPYLACAAAWAVVGVFRLIGYQIHWWWWLESHHLAPWPRRPATAASS